MMTPIKWELLINDTVKSGFSLIKPLYPDDYGKTFLAASNDPEYDVSYKVVNKTEVPHEEVERELNILSLLKHPNIAQTLLVRQNAEVVFIGMENITKSLSRILKQMGHLPEQDAKTLFLQLSRAVDYMHNAAKVSHGGITTRTILVDENFHLKLTDFSLSQQIQDEEAWVSTLELPGNPKYFSPEKKQKHWFLPKKDDLFSMGVVLFLMLTKSFPPRNDECQVDVEDICDLPFSLNCHSMLMRLLHTDLKMRLTADEILHHDWLKERACLK